MKEQAREIQYTIRGIPLEVDHALRRRAAQRKQSLNQVILDELTASTIGHTKRADFSDLVGKWSHDPGFDEVLAAQRRIQLRNGRTVRPAFVQLRRAGTPVPDNDHWIAALCLEQNLVLVTRDRHF